MSFAEAIPYVASAYAVVLAAIVAWAALAARRAARLRRRLDDLDRDLRGTAPAVSPPGGRGGAPLPPSPASAPPSPAERESPERSPGR